MLLQKQRTICIKVYVILSLGPLSDSIVLDKTWALAQASNKPLFAFALLWTSYSLSFGDLDSGHNNGKESTYNAGHLGSIPGSGRSPEEVHGNPLQNPRLGIHMDRVLCPESESPKLRE